MVFRAHRPVRGVGGRPSPACYLTPAARFRSIATLKPKARNRAGTIRSAHSIADAFEVGDNVHTSSSATTIYRKRRTVGSFMHSLCGLGVIRTGLSVYHRRATTGLASENTCAMFSRGMRESGQFPCETSGRDFLASAGILTRPEWREITAGILDASSWVREEFKRDYPAGSSIAEVKSEPWARLTSVQTLRQAWDSRPITHFGTAIHISPFGRVRRRDTQLCKRIFPSALNDPSAASAFPASPTGAQNSVRVSVGLAS